MRSLEMSRLGRFSTIGRVIATDPCYTKVQKTTGLQMVIDVKPGTYVTRIGVSDEGSWGKRVAELEVMHELYVQQAATSILRMNPIVWERVHNGCGVDSGQFGFFDLEKYPDGDLGDYDDVGSFYGRVCEMTLDKSKGGCLEFGAASRSGYGDGGYPVYVARNDRREVVGLQVVFITEDDVDYEDEGSFDDSYEENEEEER